MPIMDCLKLPDQDAVNACFENLSPWLQVALLTFELLVRILQVAFH